MIQVRNARQLCAGESSWWLILRFGIEVKTCAAEAEAGEALLILNFALRARARACAYAAACLAVAPTHCRCSSCHLCCHGLYGKDVQCMRNYDTRDWLWGGDRDSTLCNRPKYSWCASLQLYLALKILPSLRIPSHMCWLGAVAVAARLPSYWLLQVHPIEIQKGKWPMFRTALNASGC